MILLVDNGSIHTPDLKKYLKSRGINFRVAKPNSRLKSIMKHRYKGIILSGGPLLYDSAINIESVDIDLAVLLDLNVPALGICFGHQTISEAFDGRIKRLEATVHKRERIKIVKSNQLFRGLPKIIEMEEFHTDCVREVPYNFHLVATSKSCRIESIKHNYKHIYGVQFHPEASGIQGEKILDNFLDICHIKRHPKVKKKRKKKTVKKKSTKKTTKKKVKKKTK